MVLEPRLAAILYSAICSLVGFGWVEFARTMTGTTGGSDLYCDQEGCCELQYQANDRRVCLLEEQPLDREPCSDPHSYWASLTES